MYPAKLFCPTPRIDNPAFAGVAAAGASHYIARP